MIVVEISKDGTEKRIAIKDNVDELLLSEYVAIENTLEQAPAAIRAVFVEDEDGKLASVEDWGIDEWQQYYFTLGKCLECVAFQVEDGEEENSYRVGEKASLSDVLGVAIDDEAGNGIASIFARLRQSIDDFSPGQLPIEQFEHKDIRFVLPKDLVDNWGNVMPWANISGIEAIEALELERAFAESKDQAVRDARELGVIACISRAVKDGKIEQMPLDMIERRNLINKRIEFFADLPYTDAKRIMFFFASLKGLFKVMPILSRFLTLRRKMQRMQAE